MRDPNRKWAAIYGVAFHAAAVLIMVGVAIKNRAPLEGAVLARAIPLLLIASAVLYFFIVGRYVAGRVKKKGVVFLDSVIGMMVETAVVALASILYALVASLPALAAGAGAFLLAFGQSSAYTLLWIFAGFLVQILVIGNAAGLVGWLLLKKLDERAARRQGAPTP